jgi:hypothetical protein
MLLRRISPILFTGIAILATGCASTGGNPLSSSSKTPGSGTTTIQIASQPGSQTVPLGATAKFTVVASSFEPLSYQWTRNGDPIDGATSASYTTPAIAIGDSGSVFAVTITDKDGSVTSSAAKLTAGPRSPEPGDLRLLLFQQATVPGFGTSDQASNISPNVAQLFPGAMGSPLEVGSSAVCTTGVAYDCGWNFFVDYLPQSQNGFTMFYQGRPYEEFDHDLDALAGSNVVLTSLDFEPANDSYAMAWVQTNQTGGFDYRREVVAPADIEATVAQDAAQSRIITAVSFDANGQANLFSYGWSGDTTTVYEAHTVLAASADVASAATDLANEGYSISAFGGNDANGYLLIGTRVKGDNLARPLTILSQSSTVSTEAVPDSVPGTPVANLYSAGSGQVLISEY